jgi:16S rRNA (cytosine967-C5)-methyltransferase
MSQERFSNSGSAPPETGDLLTPSQSSSSSSQNVSAADILMPRKVALHLLQALFLKRSNLDQVFDESNEYQSLSQRDRAFVKMMITTVIRRLGQVDDLIKRALSRPDQPLNPPILQNILRLGVAQLLFMNVPDHAAVNTSVLLVESEGHSRMKGFINAILRKMAAEGRDWTARQDVARLNTPDWLLKIWIADYGMRTALDIAMANVQEAPLDLTVRHSSEITHWAEQLQATLLPFQSLRLHQARLIQDLPGFDEGAWWVQDVSASLPVSLMGDVTGKLVYDLCAAPGGKTAQLASRGAQVVAIDRSAKRIQRLNENLKRLGLQDHVRCEVSDAAHFNPRQKADIVLLDAPCSATGTIRRNPDVPWLKTQQDFTSLMDLQHRLLSHAADLVETNGLLFYCTCSLQKDEGDVQVERILNMRNDLQLVPFQAHELPAMTDLVAPTGMIRVLPHYLSNLGGMDGFFIARLRKVSA